MDFGGVGVAHDIGEGFLEDTEEVGFEVIDEYGDLLWNLFDAGSSWRRVLICKKNGIKRAR